MADLADAVRTKIMNAFANTPYPGDDNLVVNQSDQDPECREIARAFVSKRWEDVSPDMLREHAQALPLFTPSAFRYYLAAYMIASIDPGPEAETLRDLATFNLTPPRRDRAWRSEFFDSRASQFTTAEKGAIRSFLEWVEASKRAAWKSQGLTPPPSEIAAAIEYWEPSKWK
jgi:uncharacterized protein DUF6714